MEKKQKDIFKIRYICTYIYTYIFLCSFYKPQSQETERQSVNKGRIDRNFYVMLKFTECPKTPGIKLFPKKISCLQVIFLLIWMKHTLIWFNLHRDETGNGLSNIKDAFAESLQLQISVLHQSVCISSQVHMMAG